MARFDRRWTTRRTAAALGITALAALAAVFSGVGAGPDVGGADGPPSEGAPLGGNFLALIIVERVLTTGIRPSRDNRNQNAGPAGVR